MVLPNSLSSYYEKFLATGEVKCIDEEIPFEIPQGWEWVRLGNIATIIGGYAYKSQDFINSSNNQVLRLGNIKNDFLKHNASPVYISDDLATKTDKFRCHLDDILITMTGTRKKRDYFFSYKVEQNDLNYFINQRVGILRFYISEVSMFMIYALKAENTLQNVFQYETGTANQGNLGAENIAKVYIPLPPLSEQLRIVSKIKELIPLVEAYEQTQNELNTLNTSLNELLCKSILQEAIQGKLVLQVAEEGTAQELLERIRQEKLQLVKEGKLKKSALTDSVIYKGDDNKYYERINAQTVEIELPFEYPNNWSVLRLKDICQLIDGEKRNGKGICLDAKYLRGKSSATTVEKGKFVYAGDNIILVDGENSGEVFTVPQDGYMGSTFKQLWLSSAMWKPYILAFILFYKEDLRNSKRGAAIPHLNKELFYNLPIGIPPYQEQQRIAKRINELSQLLK
ncbi:restriction endonuclease subunit S [Oscillospiraceae bacterium N12]|jgi:type I restriction enzyme S subunit|uniref:Restriction endonuclease subunit S n=1 Tax=Jilunia laotingensis TaxID=2763675 RepID=A0A926INN3_9BACT|nr:MULTISPECIES: restriction endonuclease subunit S [Bacteroides]EFA19533.1 type I restriction modification DNA specificity domain protein [Bacteroides sp. D20]MBC8591645.1 restriction endonuclease subunit S [Jilunia laotingensis]